MPTQESWQAELAKRRKDIWDICQRAHCDIVLVYSRREHPEPFRYLTNFVPIMGDMWAVQTGPDAMTCLLNFQWELDEARRFSGLADWHGCLDLYPLLFEWLAMLKPRRIAVLGLDRLPWQMHAWLGSTLGTELESIDQPFEQMRRVKSSFEIELLREAVRVTDLAISEVRPSVRPGAAEQQITAAILHTFHQNGCDSSFFPAVIGGVDAESAVIVRKPRPRCLETGDTLMIDIGASYQGYQADVARTFILGKPNRLQQHVWDTILRAYDAVIALCRPGTPCNQLHQIAQGIVEEAGYRLSHRLGHGIGLSTSFEWPSLDTTTSELEPGMTIAVEPAVYITGAGAMKLEDCILVTEQGCETLSKSRATLDPSD